MKQICYLISLILILNMIPSFLFSNTTGENDLLTEISNKDSLFLPIIPIYIKGDIISFIHPNFTQVYSEYDAFYTLKIKKTKTIYKIYKDNSSDYFVKGMFNGWWLLAGICCDLIVCAASGKDVEVEVELWDPYAGEYYWDYETQTKYSFKLYFTAIASLIGGYNNLQKKGKLRNPKPIKSKYNTMLSCNNKITKSSTIQVSHNSNDLNIQFNRFINKTKDSNLGQFQQITRLLNQYDKEMDFSLFHVCYSREINKLNFERDEFETTKQYQERIVREQIREKEILAEYKQEERIAEEQEQIRKFELLKQIKEEIKNIEFTKSYDFEISNYNADKQSFTFNISGTKKEIIVPLMKAPKFKDNISDYIVQKTLRPTLTGTWETVSDDYVLINTKTNETIPWEGSIPTYVETAVENPPLLSASVELIEASGEGYLDAEETATI